MDRLKKLSEQSRYRARKPKRMQMYACVKRSMETLVKVFAPDKRKMRKEYRKRKKVAGPEFVRFYRAVL